MHITHWTWGPAKAGGLLGPGHSHRKALFQKASSQHNQDKKKFSEKKNTITLFY